MRQKITKNAKGREDARICLWKNGKERTHLVSRIIAMTWCEGYSDDLTVNHINGNSLDNRAENLEWCSLAENIKDGFENGLFNSFTIPIVLKNKRTKEEFKFRSMSKAGESIGRTNSYISDCIKKNRNATSKDGEVFEICPLKL